MLEVVQFLEKAIGTKAKCEFLPRQPGDALAIHANVEDLAREVDFKPAISIADGIGQFVHWFRDFHSVAHRPSALVDAGTTGR